jgi:hypothetical protein
VQTHSPQHLAQHATSASPTVLPRTIQEMQTSEAARHDGPQVPNQARGFDHFQRDAFADAVACSKTYGMSAAEVLLGLALNSGRGVEQNPGFAIDTWLRSRDPFAHFLAAQEFSKGFIGTSYSQSEENFLNVVGDSTLPSPLRAKEMQTILHNISENRALMTPTALGRMSNMIPWLGEVDQKEKVELLAKIDHAKNTFCSTRASLNAFFI